MLITVCIFKYTTLTFPIKTSKCFIFYRFRFFLCVILYCTQFVNAPAMLDVKQWSSEIECVFISTLSVSVFNNDYSAWESLVQKHDVNVKVQTR